MLDMQHFTGFFPKFKPNLMVKKSFFFQSSSKIIRILEIYVFLHVYDVSKGKYFPSFQMTF
jgi:hypothetical protein